jgi:hypothetical protein
MAYKALRQANGGVTVQSRRDWRVHMVKYADLDHILPINQLN